MSETTAQLVTALNELQEKFEREYGRMGEEYVRDMRQIIDLVLQQHEEIVREIVAPWALVGNEEKIPVEKFSNNLAPLLCNPDFMSDGEIWELLRTVLERRHGVFQQL